MDFSIEKRISNFVESQFPQFYQEEGPNFILFVKAYYEWLEESGNPIREARYLYDYRDIDNTLEKFLYYFQTKYLYGIPFNVIINKRYLLKHVLDVYRSKSSIQGYKLLFRLIYDEDVDVYLPGRDILRASDGTWKEPRYIEVTDTPNIFELIGKKIIGASSGTTGVVENYIKEPINDNIISVIYLSNILPKGGNFFVGEKVYDESKTNDPNIATIIGSAPKILGSLDYIDITNGGENFKVGDILKILDKSLSNGSIITYGEDGLVKVVTTTKKYGALNYTIPTSGFGFTTNALTFLYKQPSDTTGTGASFKVGSISNAKEIIYNTDIISDYMDLTLDSSTYGFTANSSANLTSNIGISLTYTSNVFGSLATLSSVKTGNGYTLIPNTFVKETINSKNIPGSISYTTSSNTITGTSTNFTRYFTGNSVIYIQANSSLSGTGEYHVIKTVTNSTSINLYKSPTYNSTASAIYKVSPETLKSNYTLYEDESKVANIAFNSLSELDANVYAVPSIGNNSVGTVTAINSGRGYVESEDVKLYLYSSLETPTISSGGVNYKNNEILIFSGGDPIKSAAGYVQTNSNGTITTINMETLGSGYNSIPTVSVKTSNGSNAVIVTDIQEYNTSFEISGKVVKTGLGRQRGYWSTTRGFLNSDKYIQDSYYYQDYSYQLDTALTLDKYKQILYTTFHTSGTELFGKFLLNTKENILFNSEYEKGVILKTVTDFNITVDATTLDSKSFTVDNNLITVDMEYVVDYDFKVDTLEVTVDSDLYTSDLTYIATIL